MSENQLSTRKIILDIQNYTSHMRQTRDQVCVCRQSEGLKVMHATLWNYESRKQDKSGKIKADHDITSTGQRMRYVFQTTNIFTKNCIIQKN